METQKENIRTTLVVPSELWAKVRIEKIKEGDHSLNDVVVRALAGHFRKERGYLQ